ncbi:MAG: hypothetical protein LIP01_01305, partial [Tannerellaceae bacterium]|nr:hypothetical protein [Tannerellaceae bacterium]
MAKKEKDLNQVTSLGDNEYVRALTSSGESVQIKKSNLYPLVSEETHGLMSKGDKAAIGNKQLGSKQDYEKAVILLNSVDVNGNSYAYGILFRVRTQSATSALPVIYGTGYSGAGENIYKVSHILSLGISLKLCSCTYQGKRYMAIHDPEVSR